MADLSGPEKAAVVVLALESQRATELVRNLTEREVMTLAAAIASPPKLSAEARLAVLAEYDSLLSAHAYLREGGLDKARQLLTGVYGRDQADLILHRLGATARMRPFEALHSASPEDLLSFLEGEHPQTVALVLAYIAPDLAAQVVNALSEERRVDVTERLAKLETVRPEVLHAVEEVVSERIAAWVHFDYPAPRGLDSLVALLGRAGRHVEHQVLAGIAAHDPGLAEEIRSKMFTFEDLLRLRVDVLQKVLREIDRQDLAIALRALADDTKAAFYAGLSERAAAELKEEMEESPPVPVREVEAAQGRIVARVREMDDAGEIDLAAVGTEEQLV